MSTTTHFLRSTALRCQDAIGLLPWLLNGSLEESERRQVLGHLGGCESCRLELNETVQVWQLATWHVPSLALASYAEGLETDLERQRIERHLSSCPSCREELELTRTEPVGEVVFFQREGRPRFGVRRGASDRGRRAGRLLAVAASVTLALAGGAAMWSLIDRGAPPAHVTAAAATAEPASGAATRPGTAGELPVFGDGFESGNLAAWSAQQSSPVQTRQSARPTSSAQPAPRRDADT